MKCSEFEHHLQLVAEVESNDARAGEEVVRPATSSSSYRLPEEQLLAWSFGEMGAHARQISPSLDVEQRIMKAFDRELQIKQRYTSNWPRYATAAIAATLLVATVSFALLRHKQTSESPGRISTVDLSAAVSAVESPNVQGATARSEEKLKSRDRTPRLARAKTSGEAAALEVVPEIATDFIRINYATPIEPGGQIVRVQLPRSAMSQFGVPVNMDRADQPVKADVIMGIDGVAQAIRFVQ